MISAIQTSLLVLESDLFVLPELHLALLHTIEILVEAQASHLTSITLRGTLPSATSLTAARLASSALTTIQSVDFWLKSAFMVQIATISPFTHFNLSPVMSLRLTVESGVGCLAGDPFLSLRHPQLA